MHINKFHACDIQMPTISKSMQSSVTRREFKPRNKLAATRLCEYDFFYFSDDENQINVIIANSISEAIRHFVCSIHACDLSDLCVYSTVNAHRIIAFV